MKKTSTFRGLALAFFLIQFITGAFAQVFWTETFADSVTATTNWVSGGTNPGAENWTWTTDALAGYQDPAIPAFGSPTVADGYFYFNSDANGSGNAHDVTLTGPSTPIDCSGKFNVKLGFYYQYADAAATAKAQVGISTDGMNFTYHEVLAAVAPNNIDEGTTSVNIPEADDQAQVWIQFRWIGEWEYHWKIDDVSLSGDGGAVPCDQNPMAIICDNIDSYSTAMRVGPQATWWTTWSGTEGGTEDGIVSTEQASSAPNSVKVISTAAQGGPQDVVLNLGNKDSGRYELKFKYYIPAGKNGYYNMQNVVPIGAGDWDFEVHFENNGAGSITEGSNAVLIANFTYPYDKWFEIRHVIDLDNDLISYYIDGNFVRKAPFLKNIGGIDFYGANNFNTYYVDDIEYVELPPIVYNVDECGGAIDLTSFFGQTPSIPQTTGLYDNTTATADAGDPSDITCWLEDVSGTADVVDQSMWYTFTGDGGKYHIETVPCNATNYIGVAQGDDGDTQMIIYEGSCSNYGAPIACNDDLFSNGDPDFRAGLDLQTVNGQDYLMLIDGFNFNNVVATGEFCVEITQIPSITCADGVAGDVQLLNNGFVCDGDGTGNYLALDDNTFVLPNIGPIYGISWAITTQPVPAGTWPPTLATYWGSFTTSPALYVPNLTNNGNPLTQGAIWYFTPIVVAGAADTVAATAGHFLHELDLTDACFFVGASQQMILLPALDPLQGVADFLPVTTPPGNNGAIDLTVTGGFYDLVQDPAAYQVEWSGPNGFTSQDEDLVNLAPGTYTATITDVSGCIDPIVVTVSVTVPTQDPKSVQALTITPNPARDAIMLNLTLTESTDVRIELIDMLGQVVESIDAGKVISLSRPVDLAALSAGTYLVRITAGNEAALRRVVVQR